MDNQSNINKIIKTMNELRPIIFKFQDSAEKLFESLNRIENSCYTLQCHINSVKGIVMPKEIPNFYIDSRERDADYEGFAHYVQSIISSTPEDVIIEEGQIIITDFFLLQNLLKNLSHYYKKFQKQQQLLKLEIPNENQ